MVSNFWPENIFIFAGAERQKIYTWEGSSFKLTTDFFFLRHKFTEIECTLEPTEVWVCPCESGPERSVGLEEQLWLDLGKEL